MSDKCTCCFEDFIVRCTDYIQVYAKLEPNTNYFWVITDKFDKQYGGSFTTDADGFWRIQVEDLPEGLLTEYSSSFNLQVFEDAYGCSPVKFKVAQDYDCIQFNVRGGLRNKITLGCEF
jgi:hypothetical protein